MEKLLIEHGAFVNYVDECGTSSLSILDWAIFHGNFSNIWKKITLKVSIHGGNGEIRLQTPPCPPQNIAFRRNFSILGIGKSDLIIKFYFHYLWNLDQTEIVELLIEEGAKTNYKSPGGRDSLGQAIFNGNICVLLSITVIMSILTIQF